MLAKQITPNIDTTVESRFLEPPGETQIGSRNRRVREIGGKVTVFDCGEGTTFGSSYREVRKNEDSRNRDSTVNAYFESL